MITEMEKLIDRCRQTDNGLNIKDYIKVHAMNLRSLSTMVLIYT